MKFHIRVLAGSLLIALSPLANAADPIDTQVNILDTTAKNRGQALVAGKIASNFGTLAGSDKNSLALVNALRNGTNATLTYTTAPAKPGGTPTTTTTTYDPPTGKMGWGNVKISLALAQDSLARAGITSPTAEQLQAALNGGSVTVKNPDGTTTITKLSGVLQMRADGMGWGEIAKANGTKVGPVVSQLKMANTKVAALPPADRTAKASATPVAAKSKGVTTADGSTTGSAGDKSSKGVSTAAGASAAHGSKGLVTADGVGATQQAQGNGYGRGVVTGGGGSAAGVGAAAAGKGGGSGAGLVSGGGGSASGVTSGNGAANGKGNAGGNGNGKGKGG
ncbi:MAG TPA: hypothetical protein VM029_20360 [Opitutaceae bacterium]|nr:hypothetical protein [Opitutaceae bacterium]